MTNEELGKKVKEIVKKHKFRIENIGAEVLELIHDYIVDVLENADNTSLAITIYDKNWNVIHYYTIGPFE